MKIYQKLTDELSASLKSIEENQKKSGSIGTFKVIASTSTRDRHGESILQNGWKTDNYLKNPVILADHNWSIEKIVGRANKITTE